MAGRLEGKVAVVTGGNSGIGEGIAHLFAREGAAVVLMARRAKQGQAVEASIRYNGGDAQFVQCNVTDEDSVAEAVTAATDAYGRIDLLVNNAGGGAGGNFPDEAPVDFRHVLELNLVGTFLMSQAVWPHLIAAGGGAVVNMSSLAAQRGMSPRMRAQFGATCSSYWAAKAGVDAFTRYLAGVGGEHNIRANGVRPGQIMTPGATRGTITDPDGGHHVFEKMFDLVQIVEGPGYPVDVANLVLFLVSEESRFITGEVINVDGGCANKM